MPNWCSNVVTFSGDKDQIKQVLKLLREMGRKGKKQMLGQLPDFVSKEQPHFFDIDVQKDKVYLLTKWKPNNDALVEIADNFKVGFTNIFDDLPMGLMGEAKYANGGMRIVYLDAFDFQSYDNDGETNAYLFDGETYKYEWPIFLKLLERKVAMIERNELAPAIEQEDNQVWFQTTSRISKDELVKYYNELTAADLVFKLAEYKNFDAARAAFQSWDEHTLAEMADFMAQGYSDDEEKYATRDKYLAVAFLKELIREWDDKRSQEKYSDLSGQEQTQAELLKIRLAGKLPHMDIAGVDFTVDWRLRELRETAAPWNHISIDDLTISESAEEYLGLYDLAEKKLYQVMDDITVLPQNVIGLEIPHENKLDPVAVAREHDFNIAQFVIHNPIHANLAAGILPLSKTGIPELVEENLRKSRETGTENTPDRSRKIGR